MSKRSKRKTVTLRMPLYVLGGLKLVSRMSGAPINECICVMLALAVLGTPPLPTAADLKGKKLPPQKSGGDAQRKP